VERNLNLLIIGFLREEENTVVINVIGKI